MHRKYLYMLAGGSALVAAGYAFGASLDHVLNVVQALPDLGKEGVIGAMAVVQSSYTERLVIGQPGQIADMSSYDVDTRAVENSNGIPFGRAVGRGVNDKGCVLGTGGGALALFLGVSVRDITLAPEAFDSDYVDEYRQYANAGILYRGDIWVLADGAVADGDDVTFDRDTGRLGTRPVATSFIGPIVGARWMTTAANNGLAILRLSGILPSS